jgi:hypothetical protein
MDAGPAPAPPTLNDVIKRMMPNATRAQRRATISNVKRQMKKLNGSRRITSNVSDR